MTRVVPSSSWGPRAPIPLNRGLPSSFKPTCSILRTRASRCVRSRLDCVDAPLFRVPLPPGDRTGLSAASQVMVDKVVSVPRTAIVREVGRCDSDQLAAVDDALRVWLDL